MTPGIGSLDRGLAGLVAESEALHERVRALRHAQPSPDAFDELALAIARFQARYLPGFRRLVDMRGSTLDRVSDIPAVPSDAFRLTRVAVHPPRLDSVRFLSSGTSSSQRGLHALRNTETYRDLSLAMGREALGVRSPCTVVALALAPDDPPSSSLSFMLAEFILEFDGRGSPGQHFDVHSKEHWLLGPDGVDLAGLERASQGAFERAQPLLLLATSFALAALTEGLRNRLQLPPGSRVMQTGGYKGRLREIPEHELKAEAARALGISEANIVSEYGMTELSSQLYEGSLPSGGLSGPPGVYLAPAWLRAIPVDPVTLEPVPDGHTGLARFVDLANVDSAVAIVTRDLIRRRGAGIELIGREVGSEPRGCSLAVEALLEGSREGTPSSKTF